MCPVKLSFHRSCAPGPQLGSGNPSQGQGQDPASPHLSPPCRALRWTCGTHSCPSHPQNHVNLVHRKGKTKVCPHPGCGKKFYLSNHLRRHMIIHSGQAQGRAGSLSCRQGALGLEARAGSRVKPGPGAASRRASSTSTTRAGVRWWK